MKLADGACIQFHGRLINEADLAAKREELKTLPLICPGLNGGSLSDEDAFFAFLCESTPFTISAEETARPLVLSANITRHPFTIDGKEGYAAFGIRLVPIHGDVKSVEFDRDPRIMVAYALSAGRDRLCIDLANAGLHMEISFACADPVSLIEKAVPPPVGYQKNLTSKATTPTTAVP